MVYKIVRKINVRGSQYLDLCLYANWCDIHLFDDIIIISRVKKFIIVHVDGIEGIISNITKAQ